MLKAANVSKKDLNGAQEEKKLEAEFEKHQIANLTGNRNL